MNERGQSEVGLPAAAVESFVAALLQGVRMQPHDARPMAWVYAVQTFRGVGHHDLHDLSGRLKRLSEGSLNPRPDIRLLKTLDATALIDGDNAPGELVCHRAMTLAIEKAAMRGVGLVVARSSNHFLAGAPYALLAAQNGMIGIALSNTVSSMAAPGAKDDAIGNNPFAFAAPTAAGHPIVLDICQAYASWGEMRARQRAGQTIPNYWGLDKHRQPTADPGAVLDDGLFLPMGGHKGFGLAILVELMTSVLGGAAMTDQIKAHATAPGEGHSQSCLAINLRHFMTVEQFAAQSAALVTLLKSHGAEVRVPGERSAAAAAAAWRDGVRLRADAAEQLRDWARRLNLPWPA
jgi:LDH2 family malate/lactate/ureidoglycolate dehydrogenase